MTTKVERQRAATAARERWHTRYETAQATVALARGKWLQELGVRQARRRAERVLDDQAWDGVCADYAVALTHLAGIIQQAARIE